MCCETCAYKGSCVNAKPPCYVPKPYPIYPQPWYPQPYQPYPTSPWYWITVGDTTFEGGSLTFSS